MPWTLFKDFVYGMADYLIRHSQNAATIESALNDLESRVSATGSVMVPLGLQQIFDRRGIIGLGSYDFDAGTLTGPDYNLTVGLGAYWNAGTYYFKADSTLISLAGKTTGTYYVNLLAGLPVISDTADTTTTRQFAWNDTTHVVSAKAIYTGVAILFDGDDYADCLDSAARAKSFTKLADRLEELEAMVAEMGRYYAHDHTTGLDVYYQAGKCRDADSQPHNTIAGHVTCVDDQTNYIEVDPATGTVSVNQAGFTSGSIPLFTAVTASGAVTSLTDQRTWACVGGGTGGGGHTQGTDLGTTAQYFKTDTDASGYPATPSGLEVECGDYVNAFWVFDRDVRRWKWSNDGGVTWHWADEMALDLGVQELTKYVPLTDPPLVLEDLLRDTSVDYEDLDLSTVITAPLGAQAAVLRVKVWDTVASCNALFRKAAPDAPAQAYTAWSGQTNPSTLIVPLDADLFCQFFVNASGVGTANIQIWLLGYMEKITGVGTQDRWYEQTTLNVGAGATVDFNLPGFLNRGLCHLLTVSETGGVMTGTYDLELYCADSFLAPYLLYKAVGIDPSANFEDYLPFWVWDMDVTNKLHLRIINNDEENAGIFSILLACEQFA